MNVRDKYTSVTLKLTDPDAAKKIELSDDAYAICELLESVRKKIEQNG